MKTKLILLVLALASLRLASQAVYLNRDWQDLSGNPVFNPILNPLGVEWSNSIVGVNNEIITVGHTNITGQGENIFVSKHDRDGNVIFQVNKNTAGTNNDYGIALIENPNNGDIYVCGTTDNSTLTNYDVVVMQFDQFGNLLNSATFPGSAGMNDVATAIKRDNWGNIYIAAASESFGSLYDYLLLKYSPTLGLSWTATYDFASLMEIPIGIDVGSGTDVFLTGASQSGVTNWDYAVARFNSTTGGYISDVRNNIPGTGYDMALAYKKDAANNIYFTGKTQVAGQYDIKTVKITSTYAIAWTATLDINGLDDVAATIDIDGNGNVVVGGFATNASGVTDLLCAKYNSAGALVWKYTQPSANPSGNAFIQKLALDNSSGNIYYVGGELGVSAQKEVLVGKIKANGERNWYQNIATAGANVLPSDIKRESNKIYVISIDNPTVAQYQTTALNELILDTTAVYLSGKPSRMKNRVLVTFQPGSLAPAKINNRDITHGTIRDFITPAALNLLVEQTRIREIGDFQCYKIFPWMVMDDSMSVSRSGRTIKVYPHYSSFGIILPGSTVDSTILQNFGAAPKTIRSAQFNHCIFLAASANDPEYANGNAGGLTTTTMYPGANINVEPAWDLTTGDPAIKVGIFDTGINFLHPDFGNGTFAGSKIADGYNYQGNIPLSTTTSNDIMGHGTAVGDKVGALRNNNIAIAGIAGGDGQGNTGVQLFDMKIFGQGASCNFITTIFATEDQVSSAIVQGAMNNTVTGSGFIQHIQNHSWKGTQMYSIILDALITAYQNEVMLVMAAGNDGVITDCMRYSYPASYKDHIITKVGANYESGDRVNWSECGHRLDFIAPGVASLYSSLTRTGSATSDFMQWPATNNANCSAQIDGTSFAAPHAAGAAALLLSYANNTFMPNGLFPEDVENLLQLAAKDLTFSPNFPGYDSIAGYGRIDIGKTLNNYYYPGYLVQHYSFNVSASTAYSVGAIFENTCIWEAMFGQPFGVAKVRRYKISGSNNHTVPPGYTFVTGWERNAASNLMGLNSNTAGLSGPAVICMTNSAIFEEDRYLPDATQILPVSITSTSASFDGYIYEIYDPSTNTPVGWYPFGPNGTATFAYSIYLKSNTVGLNEDLFTENAFYMYPNPTMDKIYLQSRKQDIDRVDVSLYSALGQLVYQQDNLYIGETNSIDVSQLTNGIYFAKVKYGSKTIVNKVIVSK